MTDELKTIKELEKKLKKQSQIINKLEQREQELLSIADNMPGLISYINSEERFEYVNKHNEIWFGIRWGEVIGKHTREIVGEDAYQQVNDFSNNARIGQSVQFEMPILKKDGEPDWGLVSIVPDFDNDQQIKGYFCFLSDITAQKRAQSALKESEERFRQLAENIHEVFWLRSGDGRQIIYVSPAYENIWRRTSQSLFDNPQSLAEAIHPGDRSTVKNAFDVARFQQQNFDQEYRILRPDGTVRWIRDRGFPVQNEDGNIHRIAGIAEDITQWKLAEEQLRDNQRQLRSLASEVSLAEERERRKIASDLHDHVGQTLALAKIKLGGHGELLTTDDQLKSITEIRELLDHAIRDTRSLYLELSPPVLYELGFESAVEWLSDRVRKQHGIVCHVQDDGVQKPLDDDIRVVLFQAVRELLFNVAKHAQVSNANVNLKRIDNQIQVQVQDEGIGFDVELAISDVLGKHNYGLFSIRERVGVLGGTFNVDSEPGKGTLVTITAALKLPE